MFAKSGFRVALGAVLLLLMLTTADSSAKVGEPLKVMAEKPLFHFYHLSNLDSILALRDQSKVVLSPTTEYLHGSTQLNMRLGPTGKVQIMQLVFDRKFVEDDWVRARSLTVDFLHTTIPLEDELAVTDFANEVEYPAGKEIRYNTSIPKLPSTPTILYQAFHGERKVSVQEMQKSIVMVENVKAMGTELVRITVLVRDAGSAPLIAANRNVR